MWYLLCMDKTLILYHANCPDGLAAAWVARKFFGPANVECIPVFHGKEPPDVTGRTVYILDFAYKPDVLEEMRAKAFSLVVIDHHVTARDDLAGQPNCHFDMNHSGCVLAWKFFFQGEDVAEHKPVPVFLQYVEDRDLFRNQLLETEEVAAARYSYPPTFETLDELIPDDTFAQARMIDRLREEGSILLRGQRVKIAEMADNVQFFDIGGYLVPVVNASVFFSDVAAELYKRYPGYPFAAYYFDRGDGIRQWGLFNSNDSDFDVSMVARMYGGGGHKHAAGFQQDITGNNPLLLGQVCDLCGIRISESERLYDQEQAG